LLFGQILNAMLAVVLNALILFTHRENISRLLRGQEPRIGDRATSP
jgi:glycerol-3-phosphate acyltransferase PlsY